MPKLVPIIIFGFDYDSTHTKAGRGTMMRCQAGARLRQQILDRGDYPLIIVSPGRAPDVTLQQQPKTMAEMMREYLLGQRIPSIDIGVAGSGREWGTRDELVAAVSHMLKLQEKGNRINDVYLVSNRLHLLRILVLAGALSANLHLGWQWHDASCEWNVPSWTRREQVKEFCKFLVECARAWRWRPQV